jgi:tRNA/rRNA methyltransferase
MANLGLSRLVIAGSPGLCGQPGARHLAVHSEEVLEGAREVPDFAAAVDGADLIIGTTAHDAYETWEILDPWQALALARDVSGDIALVFGSERYGLPKTLLRQCHQVMHLPTARPGQSLNLAQAVLLVAWEWSLVKPAGIRASESASASAFARVPDTDTDTDPGKVPVPADLGPYWPDVLEAAGVLKPHNRDRRLATLRRILSRLRLTEEEAALLRGAGSKLALFTQLRGVRRGS